MCSTSCLYDGKFYSKGVNERTLLGVSTSISVPTVPLSFSSVLISLIFSFTSPVAVRLLPADAAPSLAFFAGGDFWMPVVEMVAVLVLPVGVAGEGPAVFGGALMGVWDCGGGMCLMAARTVEVGFEAEAAVF